MANKEENYVEEYLRISEVPIKTYAPLTLAAILPLNGTLFLLRPFLDQLLIVFLTHRNPALLIPILVHEVAGLVIVVRYARRFGVLRGRERSVLVHDRADHQHQYRASDGSETTVRFIMSRSTAKAIIRCVDSACIIIIYFYFLYLSPLGVKGNCEIARDCRKQKYILFSFLLA